MTKKDKKLLEIYNSIPEKYILSIMGIIGIRNAIEYKLLKMGVLEYRVEMDENSVEIKIYLPKSYAKEQLNEIRKTLRKTFILLEPLNFFKL
jgi:hypothetical protein